MSQTMYDSIAANSLAIPADATMVAGYDDGHSIPAWTDTNWASFPSAIHVHITTNGETLTSEVADVEKGDLDPAGAADWIRRRVAAGITGTPKIYCSLSSVDAVNAACAGLTYKLWVADWTGVEHIPDGAVACQYAPFGTFDKSIVSDDWFDPDPESGLITALAYVCDTLGDKIKSLAAELQDTEAEMARVREQFLGAR